MRRSRCWRCKRRLAGKNIHIAPVGGVCSPCEARIECARQDPKLRGERFFWRGKNRGGVSQDEINRFVSEAGLEHQQLAAAAARKRGA